MKIGKIANIIIESSLIAFGLFVAYQVIRIIIGGSWEHESAITALVIMNIGMTFTIAIHTTKGMTRISTEIKHLRNQFNSLATDFKECTKECKKR